MSYSVYGIMLVHYPTVQVIFFIILAMELDVSKVEIGGDDSFSNKVEWILENAHAWDGEPQQVSSGTQEWLSVSATVRLEGGEARVVGRVLDDECSVEVQYIEMRVRTEFLERPSRMEVSRQYPDGGQFLRVYEESLFLSQLECRERDVVVTYPVRLSTNLSSIAHYYVRVDYSPQDELSDNLFPKSYSVIKIDEIATVLLGPILRDLKEGTEFENGVVVVQGTIDENTKDVRIEDSFSKCSLISCRVDDRIDLPSGPLSLAKIHGMLIVESVGDVPG